ncbi:1-aminocyclopropane-1-carboxylate deaminase/D-cysteine desulfhydrase [Haliea sp. E17]|uniref:1-aminocyclopropane-1-carboxylate deaminase/D-cysteine desulfhydrase n=1 Tax=Haliea sp. E17 TaxID=3401576 RepID=UPI003AAF4379
MARAGLNFPPRISLARTPTPLQYLSRATDRWGGEHRLWIKRDDLTGCTLSGNKVRKLEFITAFARDNGYDVLMTCGGIQSNHARATAFAGAQLGMPVHLVLRGEASGPAEGNLLLDRLAGAQVSCYSLPEYLSGLEQIFRHWESHYAEQGLKALAIPTGGSDGLGVWGYIAASEELAGDFARVGIENAHIVCATGSGGTQAGLTLGVQLFELDAPVWGVNVCDDEQYFLDKVAHDTADWRQRFPQAPAIHPETRVIDGYVGAGYAKAGPAIFDLIAEFAALEGIVLDPVYTGKAFAGMVEEIAAGRFAGVRDIVFVHTGGIFGLFPQSGGFRW